MIKYDTPFEVTEKQYRFLMHKYRGILAGQVKGSKCFVKCWDMRYKELIEQDLNNN